MEKDDVRLAKRSRRSWYFYDFGNSAYASVILLAVYSAYFKNVVVGGAEGTRLWGLSVGVAAIIVAIISPILGTIADFTKSKKRFLLIFTILSVIFTALLFFVGAGDVFTGMFFFIMAEIGYRAAQVFYDALLTEVSTPESIGSVSGKGWAVGMIGGIAALLIVLAPIQLIGPQVIHYAFLITALFYMLSALPTFLWVHEKLKPEHIPMDRGTVMLGFRKLWETIRSVRHYKNFFTFMIAFLIYNDGIMMLMDFAAIIGATLFGMQQIQLILFVIVIQAAGTLGALLFGRYSDRKSSKDAVLVALLILVGSIVALFFIKSIIWFFVIGFLAGFSLSGAQAVSRSMVSQLAPAAKTTEFYGLLSVAGRTSTFIGPLVFGSLSYRMHNWYQNHGYSAAAAEQNGMLWGVASILLFLVAGMIVLLAVRRIVAGGATSPAPPAEEHSDLAG